MYLLWNIEASLSLGHGTSLGTTHVFNRAGYTHLLHSLDRLLHILLGDLKYSLGFAAGFEPSSRLFKSLSGTATLYLRSTFFGGSI